jgi:hypothetical protein
MARHAVVTRTVRLHALDTVSSTSALAGCGVPSTGCRSAGKSPVDD